MADILKNSFVESERHQKVVFQRGKDAIDFELNEFQDILRVQQYRAMQEGVSGPFLNPGSNDDGFLVVGAGLDNEVTITAGTLFPDGIPVINLANFQFTGFTTSVGSDRTDIVYMALNEVEIPDPAQIPQLGPTTVRQKLNVVLAVAEGVPIPVDTVQEIWEGGTHFFAIATVARFDGVPAINLVDVVDDRIQLPASRILAVRALTATFADGTDVTDNADFNGPGSVVNIGIVAGGGTNAVRRGSYLAPVGFNGPANYSQVEGEAFDPSTAFPGGFTEFLRDGSAGTEFLLNGKWSRLYFQSTNIARVFETIDGTVLEQCGFDLNHLRVAAGRLHVTGCVFDEDGSSTQDRTVRFLSGVLDVVFDRCTFRGPGTSAGSPLAALYANGDLGKATFRNCVFTPLRVDVPTVYIDAPATRDWVFEDCEIQSIDGQTEPTFRVEQGQVHLLRCNIAANEGQGLRVEIGAGSIIDCTVSSSAGTGAVADPQLVVIQGGQDSPLYVKNLRVEPGGANLLTVAGPVNPMVELQGFATVPNPAKAQLHVDGLYITAPFAENQIPNVTTMLVVHGDFSPTGGVFNKFQSTYKNLQIEVAATPTAAAAPAVGVASPAFIELLGRDILRAPPLRVDGLYIPDWEWPASGFTDSRALVFMRSTRLSNVDIRKSTNPPALVSDQNYSGLIRIGQSTNGADSVLDEFEISSEYADGYGNNSLILIEARRTVVGPGRVGPGVTSISGGIIDVDADEVRIRDVQRHLSSAQEAVPDGWVFITNVAGVRRLWVNDCQFTADVGIAPRWIRLTGGFLYQCNFVDNLMIGEETQPLIVVDTAGNVQSITIAGNTFLSTTATPPVVDIDPSNLIGNTVNPTFPWAGALTGVGTNRFEAVLT